LPDTSHNNPVTSASSVNLQIITGGGDGVPQRRIEAHETTLEISTAQSGTSGEGYSGRERELEKKIAELEAKVARLTLHNAWLKSRHTSKEAEVKGLKESIANLELFELSGDLDIFK
jgi:predicted RNase H-like nuclease (RuvC/YqgF family)